MMRKLVTVQTIAELSPIPNADNIEAARVMGWTVVVRKGEFAVGDPCVFFEIDSVLPDGVPWSEFMRPRGFRVKTLRLRGVLSQGLALPLSAFGSLFTVLFGTSPPDDMAAFLGVTKHEPPLPTGMDCAGPFPTFVPKTDEIRLQSCPGVLDELGEVECVVTTKLDGQSATYLREDDGALVVCSRNWALVSNGSPHWELARRLRLAEVLPVGFALQGEVCGPGIAKNRLGLSRHELFAFDVYDVRGGRYLGREEMEDFCATRRIEPVPVERVLPASNVIGVAGWLALAAGLYDGTKNRKEGIVVRPLRETRSAVLGGRLSFKVINNEYLLKDED